MMQPESTKPRSPEPARRQALERTALGLALVFLGVWTLREFLPALVWAGILAIAVWPLYCRARTRFPPRRHDILLPTAFTLAVALLFLVPLGFAGVQLAGEAH